MSTTIRAKGQDCRVTFTSPSEGVVDVLNQGGIKDWEATIKLKKLQEGYQGETTDRYDDIFEGLDGNMTVHVTGGSRVFDFIQSAIDRARRVAAAEGQFSMIVAISFGTGQRARLVLTDVAFGPMPISSPARDEYVTFKLDFSCSEGRFLPG